MGARRSPLNTGLRIAVTLAAGLVVGAAAPSTHPGAVGQPPTCRSRSDCGPRVMGGLQITFTGWSCTTGFVARDTRDRQADRPHSGSLRGGQRAVSSLVAPWRGDRAGIGRRLPSRLECRRRRDRPRDARATNEVYGSSRTDIRRVTAWASNASQTVGSKVCRSGGTSGWGCGTIVVADVDATIDGRLIHHTWWTDFPSAAGDSGSPVLDRDGKAAGIVIATTPTQSLYSTVDWIATEVPGASLCYAELRLNRGREPFLRAASDAYAELERRPRRQRPRPRCGRPVSVCGCTPTLPTVVPEPRFELGRPCGPRSLSPLRLPFRHSGVRAG